MSKYPCVVSLRADILAFQRMFQIIMEHPDESCLFSFVFDQPVRALEKLQPKTRFQQLVLDHVKSGRKLYDGFGFQMIEADGVLSD